MMQKHCHRAVSYALVGYIYKYQHQRHSTCIHVVGRWGVIYHLSAVHCTSTSTYTIIIWSRLCAGKMFVWIFIKRYLYRFVHTPVSYTDWSSSIQRILKLPDDDAMTRAQFFFLSIHSCLWRWMLTFNRLSTTIRRDIESWFSFSHSLSLSITELYSHKMAKCDSIKLVLYGHGSIDMFDMCGQQFLIYCPKFSSWSAWPRGHLDWKCAKS